MKIESYPNFYDVVRGRYSCREYSPAPVSRHDIMAVMDAVRLAPSACNRQPWTFVVLETPEQRQLASSTYGRAFAAQAPVIIVACGEHDKAWHRASDGKDHTDVDVAIAVEHLCLAAATLGLGTCWICNFDAPALSANLGLPEGVEPIAMITLGYPAEGAKVPEKNRKTIDEIVRWGKY